LVRASKARLASRLPAQHPKRFALRTPVKVLWLTHDNIVAKWSKPLPHWELILNQLTIRFADRIPL